MRALLALVTFVIATPAAFAADAADPPAAKGGGPAAKAAQPLRREKPADSPITDHFALRASYFMPDVNTALRLDSRAGRVGTALDGETDLGLDDRLNMGRAEAMFRLLQRNRIRVDVFRTSRYGEQRLTRPINVGEQTFLAGDLVATDLDYDSLAFTYTYSVIRNRRFEAGVGLGVHLIQADLRAQVASRFQRQDASATGVFPTVAIDGTYVIAKRWSANLRAQYLSGSASSFSGSMSDYHFDAQYRWKPNFAVGLGYSAIHGRFDAAKRTFTGSFDLRARGPELFLRVSF